MLTPGGINAGRLSACLHPCPCHRTLALTNSLTAMPGLCSRHAHQSGWSQGAVLLKIRAMQQTRGSQRNMPIYIICSQHKYLYPPPQVTFPALPLPQAHAALHRCSKHPFAASASQDLPPSATALKTDGLSQSFIGSKRLQALMRKKKALSWGLSSRR